MDLFMFFAIYFAGFVTAVKMFFTIIYWKEIKSCLSNLKEKITCQWIMWKYR